MLADLAVALMLHLPADRDPHPSRAQVSRIATAAALPPKGWAAFARCVERRESHGNPRAVNHGSGAAGLVQFMPAWRHGLPYMVAERLRDHGMSSNAARTVRIQLQHLPIQRWSVNYQRIGFAQVLAAGGWRHWSGGHGCNGLAAS